MRTSSAADTGASTSRRPASSPPSAAGVFVGGIRFTYEGGQIRSLLSLLSYFGKGEMRERSFGIEIPPTNLKPDFGEQATAFANELADSVSSAAQVRDAASSPKGDG